MQELNSRLHSVDAQLMREIQNIIGRACVKLIGTILHCQHQLFFVFRTEVRFSSCAPDRGSPKESFRCLAKTSAQSLVIGNMLPVPFADMSDLGIAIPSGLHLAYRPLPERHPWLACNFRDLHSIHVK